MTRSLEGWLTYVEQLHPRNIDMGLERVAAVADRLQVSRPAPVSVIVAGTNGKGSTTVALEALLLAAGHRVGATLSPHVSRFNERVRLGGAELKDAALCASFRAVEHARRDTPLTYFEFAALVALHAFSEARVDFAILEVGLGGRLDAFNLVDAQLAIVTSIGLDHADYLGTDLEGIGREKAGVFRPQQMVVLGDVTDSVRVAAQTLDCRTLSLGVDFTVTESADEWSYVSDTLSLGFSHLRQGSLAPSNCALALTAAALLVKRDVLAPEALARTRLTGRMDRYRYENAEVIVDVAHNPAAAAFLAERLQKRFPGRRYVAILGMLADKDAPGVVAALEGLVRHWLTISVPGARGQTGPALRHKLGLPEGAITVVAVDVAAEQLDDALRAAVSLSETGDGILVLGSFSAVEQAQARLAECSEQRGTLETDG